jgi:hypothetical protein
VALFYAGISTLGKKKKSGLYFNCPRRFHQEACISHLKLSFSLANSRLQWRKVRNYFGKQLEKLKWTLYEKQRMSQISPKEKQISPSSLAFYTVQVAWNFQVAEHEIEKRNPHSHMHHQVGDGQILSPVHYFFRPMTRGYFPFIDTNHSDCKR